jgi:hypothetical protein
MVNEDKDILAVTAVWSGDEGVQVQVGREEDEAKRVGARVRAV